VNEKMVERFILRNPSSLGLGELTVYENQKDLGGGIVDIIADSKIGNTRYVIELQLGELNPDHIIRLIEYWNNERRENPDKKYRAVLIAEKTTRYLDVLYLLQEVAPIIVLQMFGIKQEGKECGILFTKVLNYTKEKTITSKRDMEPKTLEYWVSQSSKETMDTLNSVFELIQSIKIENEWQEEFSLNYTKFYIGIMVNSVPRNFIYFRAGKKRLKCVFKMNL
jgi:hypothetical protein